MSGPSAGFSDDGLRDPQFAVLLAAAKRGEAVAVETLFHDLQPRLLRYLRGMEPNGADDIAGEVWVSVARGIRGFEGDLRAWRGWVFTIARRRLSDYRRSAGRRRTDIVPDMAECETAGSIDEPAALLLDRVSGQEAVDLIVRALPPEQAEVVLLRVLVGLGVAEVATMTGRTANWVRVAQHRAFRRLASLLGDRSDYDGTVVPGKDSPEM